MRHTNNLIGATSPYLKQHAHNPVDWYQWDESLFDQAKKLDKLVLISIGYSACHWCHVMEHESFEDTAVAFIMNKNFISIKVDREERPDVDHYYMSAVQLMKQQGGWPLNVVALPDGRPIWGGTYFPKELWIKNLTAIAEFYAQNKQKTEEYAEQLHMGIEQALLVPEIEKETLVSAGLLERAVDGWKQYFDMEEGGRKGAPKFPMPVNLQFLMYYGWVKEDNVCLDYVRVTLESMVRGGIYDQLGGGFARYSVDDHWKVPHFEKMLYDNAQLLSLYSNAYQLFGNEEFRTAVYETVAFMEREMKDESGAFYSALDADSEGVEGKFYVWKLNELQKIVDDDFKLFAEYYNVNSLGFWEQGNYILIKKGPDRQFALKHNISEQELELKVARWKFLLLKERNKRIRPGLDDKTLTSWNALAIQGLLDAYRAFNDEHFLKLAVQNADFILQEQLGTDNSVKHSWKDNTSAVDGFLEDYALFINALLSLFELTGNDKWLKCANALNNYCSENFYNEETGLYYFSETKSKSLISNHYQKEDNVIPAANSVMANNLHRLYLLNASPDYLLRIQKMLSYVTSNFTNYPMAYANWGSLMLKLSEPFFEVAVCGVNAQLLLKEFKSTYRPNVLMAFCERESEVALLKNRFVVNADLIYVCKEGVCQLPVKSLSEAITLMEEK